MLSAAAVVRRSDRLSGTKRQLLTLEIAAAELKRHKAIEEEELKVQGEVEERTRREKLDIQIREYVQDLDPRLGELIRQKAFDDIYDHQELWRIKQWAERQLERVANRSEAAHQWRDWLQSVSKASQYASKFALIKDEDGNPVTVASLRPVAQRRYHTQLTALRHVYTHLLADQIPGTFWQE